MKDFFKKEKPLQGWTGFGGGATSIRMGAAIDPYITATGGTKSTPGDGYIYHQFLGGGTFTVENAGVGPTGIIDLCVVGGGGGGSLDNGGGGGAGGFRITTVDIASYGAGNYPISVGNGGQGQPSTGPTPNRPPASPGDPSYFSIPSSITPSPFQIISGGGGAGGPLSPTPSPLQNQGKPGEPHPFPTNSPPHPNAVAFPGSGGGSRQNQFYGGDGAGSPFNSSPGTRGSSGGGGAGGGAGETGWSPTSPGSTGGAGKQLPWALPTWGWGENNSAGRSGAAPSSPNPTRPAGPGGELPWGYGWFAGGGGGGRDEPGQIFGAGRAGSGDGSRNNMIWGGPPNTGSDGFGGWAAPGTGSGGGGTGGSGSVMPPVGGARGGSGAVMIRYPAA
tara:strand:- start:772 stop:1938 length:1167 start_codon:yes stop_codon:yes gene_type:complete